MGSIYNLIGMNVGVIKKGIEDDERREEYE